MKRLLRKLPIFFLIVTAAGLGYASRGLNMREGLGPRCDLKEKFVTAGRPVYWHHCKCLGWKYYESPPPYPGAEATRCLGVLKKSWTDVDEIALRELETQEREKHSAELFARLSKDDQKKVQDAYRDLRQGAFRHDYPFMLDRARVILALVDDYGETKTLEELARKAREAGGIQPEDKAPLPLPKLTDPPTTDTATATSSP